MPPPENAFSASELPERIQVRTSGKRRKQPISLEDCALKQLTQYNCEVDKNREIVCWPIVRLFRRLVRFSLTIVDVLDGDDVLMKCWCAVKIRNV